MRFVLLAMFGLGVLSCQKPQPPDYGQVPTFSLVDQNGVAFSSDLLKGKVWVANFMFTRCPSICPRLTQQMAALVTNNAGFVGVSFSVDPEFDTPDVLKTYAKKNNADLQRWVFLTGARDDVAKVMTQGLKVAIGERRGEDISHSGHFVLVDGNGHIRGFYASSDETKMKLLEADIKALK